MVKTPASQAKRLWPRFGIGDTDTKGASCTAFVSDVCRVGLWYLLCKIRFWGRAHRIKPSTDIYLRVGFPAKVTRSIRTRRCLVPSEHSQFGVAAPNNEPVTGAAAHATADFASEFLKGGHIYCFPSCSSMSQFTIANLDTGWITREHASRNRAWQRFRWFCE